MSAAAGTDGTGTGDYEEQQTGTEDMKRGVVFRVDVLYCFIVSECVTLLPSSINTSSLI